MLSSKGVSRSHGEIVEAQSEINNSLGDRSEHHELLCRSSPRLSSLQLS